MRRLLLGACALMLLAGTACEDPAGDGKAGPPAGVDVVSGDDQAGPVGTQLPQALVVRVLDDDGDPVPGAAVSFVVTAGGGSVSTASVQTDDAGEARTQWTLGTVAGDSQYVQARAVSSSGQVLATATFSAMGTPGNPAAITPVGPAARTGTAGQALADSLAVRVTDQHGNPVSGAAVVWSVRSGGGSISPPSTTTGAGGIARASWTLGSRLDSVQVAQAAAGIGLVTEFTAQAGLPLGAQIVKLSGDGQVGTVGQPLPQPLRVAVRTMAGQPLPGVTVHWSTSGNGGFTPASSVTDANGEAQSVWQLGAASGQQFAFATVPGLGQVTFTAGSHPGPVATLLKESGDGQAGSINAPLASPVVVSARDQYGNPVPGATITWTVTSGGGSAAPPTSTTSGSGRASTAWTLGPATGTQTLRASTGTVAPVTFSATATANPGAPASVTLSHTAFTMSVAATENLRATVRNAAGAELTVSPSWYSSNPAVAEVRVPPPPVPSVPADTREVVVIGRAPGTAQIIATAGGVADTANVTVVPLDLVSVEAGNDKSCGLSALAEALCWGGNGFFALGNSTGTSVPQPQGVQMDSTVTRIATSQGSFGCALRGDGRVFCWGSNGSGQLGIGSSQAYGLPAPVAGGHTFTGVWTGGNHACALTAAGQAWCWGGGIWGQLGNGGEINSSVPVQVLGGHAFVELALGQNHSCGRTSAGAVHCWGSNEYLQLGVATTTESCDGGVAAACSTTPVAVSGAPGFASITASLWTNCGLTSGGAAHCWGKNVEGTLGNGGTANSAAPVAVSGGLTFSQLDGGGEAMCGVGVGGQAYCWGWAVLVLDSTTPVPVGGAFRFTAISAGDHLCGMATDGAAYCWGANGSGQLGDGTTTNRTSPTRVAVQQ